MIKRINNALLSLMAVFVLAACGSGEPQSNEANAGDRSATANSDTSQSVSGDPGQASDAGSSANADNASDEPGIPRQIDPVPEPVATVKDEMLAQINDVRAQGATCGDEIFGPAQPVRWDVNVESAAALHNAYMRAEESVSHIGQGDSKPSQRLTESGFDWHVMGENIAAGYPTVSEVVAGWMNSNGHCRNIMNPLFDTIGADKADGYLTSDFINYWTLVLAAASPAS